MPTVISVLTPFIVPEGLAIESINVPISRDCRGKITTENFGTLTPFYGKLIGGFIKTGEHYTIESAILAVTQYSKKTRRRFRIGTLLEAFVYKKGGHPHPPLWTILNKASSGNIVGWDRQEFSLLSQVYGFSVKHWIFVVEEDIKD